jgi:hypothetical protein
MPIQKAALEAAVLVVNAKHTELMLGVWHCSSCDLPLGSVMADEGGSYVASTTRLHTKLKARRAEVDCPGCHSVQKFFSRPLSAVRLGIGEIDG